MHSSVQWLHAMCALVWFAQRPRLIEFTKVKLVGKYAFKCGVINNN